MQGFLFPRRDAEARRSQSFPAGSGAPLTIATASVHKGQSPRMVMAGAVTVGKELNTQLPGNAETRGPTETVDERVIAIAETGEVALNDEPMDTPTSHERPTLKKV